MGALIEDKLNQALHVIEVGFFWDGPAPRPVLLWFGGGSKWGGGMASEGVMNRFQWDPERAAKAPLTSAEGCFDQDGQVFLFVHKWAVGHLCVEV